MASRRNKKGGKKNKETTPQADEPNTNQDFTQSAQEEQKVEDVIETKPTESVVENTEENTQANTEATHDITHDTISTIQEQEPEPVAAEPQETQPAEVKPVEEEKVEEATEVKEPTSAENAENRLFTIEGEAEPVEQPEVKEEPVENKEESVENKEVSVLESSSVLQESTNNPEIISFDAPSKTDDLAQSTNTLYTSTAEVHESKEPVLTNSLNEKWEEIHPVKVETRVEEPAIVHKRESVDESAFEKKVSIIAGDDDIRSDRASDNAIQTRVMDEIHDSSVPLFKEHSDFESAEERIKKAEDQIREGKALKTQGKFEQALALFNSALVHLNPSSFQNANSEKLNLVHKTIQHCTLELADNYNLSNDFHQSTRFAKSVLENDAENIRAVYLYGIGLIRLGEMDQAHVIFKDFKGVGTSADDEQYKTLINRELEKLNQIADSKNKALRVSTTLEETQPLVRNTSHPINKVPEEKQEERTDGEDKESGKGSAAEYFLGSLVSTSAVGFVISKYLLKFSVQKGLIASLAIGAAVGGVSLIVRNALRKDNQGKK